MDTVTFRAEVQGQIEEAGRADIVVGIPSFNSAHTIGHVVRAAQAGLAKYFPEHRAVIVNSDGGSSDGTMEVVRNTSIADFDAILLHHRISPVSRMAFPYSGIPGKGSAFRAIFEVARMLDAQACVVIDSDLRSITPEWIELLVKPVLSGGFDYVAPLYHRHKFDGTITNSIVYPLTRALYGKRVRQPIGGDFGFSGKLAQFYLTKEVWDSDVARFGIDIWMTTTAIANGFKVAQSFLGAKIHDAKDPGADLGDMLYQVVSATFELMEGYADAWGPVRGSEPVPIFGFEYTVGLEHVNVNTARMLKVFREGLVNLREIWMDILGAGDLQEVERLGKAGDGEFRFPTGLWARIVYDYAIAFHQRKLSREHLIKSLLPLYMGKTAAFVIEVEPLAQHEAEEAVERLCLDFENGKDYLLARWK
ncbi:MAG: cell wall biosynthesis glycosyltransferase [Gallionella sp.]|jgi:glycosyltransferase involved in cell wall biosynthesis|nr:cell wall biosynthesis glycosyltransferase [Gallionella sp.]MCK9354103.1 cell wall biosynthesis glycosyltransferase [Gallionella sp.]